MYVERWYEYRRRWEMKKKEFSFWGHGAVATWKIRTQFSKVPVCVYVSERENMSRMCQVIEEIKQFEWIFFSIPKSFFFSDVFSHVNFCYMESTRREKKISWVHINTWYFLKTHLRRIHTRATRNTNKNKKEKWMERRTAVVWTEWNW